MELEDESDQILEANFDQSVFNTDAEKILQQTENSKLFFSKQKVQAANQEQAKQIQKEIDNDWQKFGLFETGPLKKVRRRKVDNICKASVCLKIAGQKEEDDLMFIELIGS